MKARKSDIELWSIKDINGDPDKFGISGSPTRVVDTEVPPPRKRETVIIKDKPTKAVKRLLKELNLEVRG